MTQGRLLFYEQADLVTNRRLVHLIVMQFHSKISRIKTELGETRAKLASSEGVDVGSEEDVRVMKEREERSEEKEVIKQLELANGELFNELKAVNESRFGVTEEFASANAEIARLAKSEKELREKGEFLSGIVSQTEVQCEKYEEKLRALKMEMEHEKERNHAMEEGLVKFDDQAKDTKDTLQAMFLKLKVTKNQLAYTMKENNILKLENDRLNHRNSVGVDHLTPRPDFVGILSDANLNIPKIDHWEQFSTSNKLAWVLENLAELKKFSKSSKKPTRNTRMFTFNDLNDQRGSLSVVKHLSDEKKIDGKQKLNLLEEELSIEMGFKRD